LNQSFKNIEIILVDDESPDRCPAMCDEYAKQDPRIIVIHKNNEGLGYARNTGLEVATGKYITFLDSDDYIDIDAYQSLFEIIEHNNSDAVYFSYERFYNEKKIETRKNGSIRIYDNEEAVKQFLLDMIANPPHIRRDRNFEVSSCCAIYRKDTINRNNIKFHSERELISEDLIFNVDFLVYSKCVVYFETPFYHYRINQKSLSSTVRMDRIERNCQLYRFCIEQANTYGLGREAQSRFMRLLIGYNRSAIKQLCTSNLDYSKKKKWLKSVCNDSIWTQLSDDYPIEKLAFYPRMFFRLTQHSRTFLLFIISYLKK